MTRLGRLAGSARRLIALVAVTGLLHPELAASASPHHARVRRHRPPARRIPGKTARQVRRHVARGTRGTADEHVNVRRGDTLDRILAAHGVGATEARPWLVAAAGVYDLRTIHPRRGLTLRFDRETHALAAIRYQIDDHALLVLEEQESGIRARREALPYFVEVRGVAARIDERGLREDATDSGVPPRVVSDLADIFGWDVDVASGLHPGDWFRVIYEDVWQAGGEKPEPGNVLGAEIVTNGAPTTAVFFQDADGRAAYYRPNGEPVSRTWLRYPLEFAEVTSEFSLLRRHPILHRFRPHLGVDFAAPRGTPVRAVASGTVTYSGWVHELGQCVRIGHAEALTSTYGHLARIAAGIEAGTAVERGQVIGYVGATGLATGPHLHYAVFRDGEYVDPMAVTAPAEEPIAPPARRAFERVQAEVTRELAALPETAHPLTVSLSDQRPRVE